MSKDSQEKCVKDVVPNKIKNCGPKALPESDSAPDVFLKSFLRLLRRLKRSCFWLLAWLDCGDFYKQE